MYGYPESFGTDQDGLRLRARGVLVALASDLYFLFIDPADTPGWVLAAIAQYRTRLALALFLFLAILAALRVRPTRLDPGVPYRSLLLRDGALAATVVAVMVGITLFLTTALQATLLAGTARDYAREAAPKVVSYVNEVRMEIRQERKARGLPEKVRISHHRRRLQRSRQPCNHPVCGISVVLWPTSFCAPSSSERLAGWSGRSAAVLLSPTMRSPEGRHAGNEPAERGTGRCGVAPRRCARRAPRDHTPDRLDGVCDLGVREEGAENGQPGIQAPRWHRARRLIAFAGVRLYAEAPGRRALQAKVDDGDCLDLYHALYARPRWGCRGRRDEAARRTARKARTQVGHLVGRDTGDLSESEICRAAVESVAENTSDGVVAPMLYGVLFGAPGALAYKAVNTLDSMVGYRQPPYEDLGWASARLDDLANLAPSRLTMLSTAAISGRPLRTLLTAVRYGPLTASPNAGMAEAAFAGALGVKLGGANTYGGVLREDRYSAIDASRS